MTLGSIAYIKDLPGSWIADQIRARSYFDAGILTPTTTDIKLVAKHTRRMKHATYVEVGAWTPFIPVYTIHFHRGKFITTNGSSSEEKVAVFVTCESRTITMVTWLFQLSLISLFFVNKWYMRERTVISVAVKLWFEQGNGFRVPNVETLVSLA